MTTILLPLAGVVLLALVVWAGTRMVLTAEGGAGSGNALGGLAEVFDPGQARSQRDLHEQLDKTEIAPSTGSDDRPMRVDLAAGVVRLRRP